MHLFDIETSAVLKVGSRALLGHCKKIKILQGEDLL
jgi:hypothetical protein